jgi:hypothetical protein
MSAARTARIATVAALTLLLGACSDFQEGFKEGYSGTSTTPAPDPDLRPGLHHVVYTWGISRKLKGDEWRNIGLGWTNPGTGARELPPKTGSASTKALQFPYVVQFDVTDLRVDNQHVAASAVADLANVAVDCTITVDGQVLAVDPGKKAVMGSGGTVETGGDSWCVPPHK